MIKAQLKDALFYAIFDPNAVTQGIAIGLGKKGTITLGGRTDPGCGGGPLILEVVSTCYTIIVTTCMLLLLLALLSL